MRRMKGRFPDLQIDARCRLPNHWTSGFMRPDYLLTVARTVKDLSGSDPPCSLLTHDGHPSEAVILSQAGKSTREFTPHGCTCGTNWPYRDEVCGRISDCRVNSWRSESAPETPSSHDPTGVEWVQNVPDPSPPLKRPGPGSPGVNCYRSRPWRWCRP